MPPDDIFNAQKQELVHPLHCAPNNVSSCWAAPSAGAITEALLWHTALKPTAMAHQGGEEGEGGTEGGGKQKGRKK